MPNVTPITPPRVPLIDPRTGLIDRAWYLFFLSLNNIASNSETVDVGTDTVSLIASYDAALQALAQVVDTQPLPTDLSAELTKQIEAAGLAEYSTALISQVAEIQKQIDALNLLPPPAQGTITAVTGTAPVVSSGGTTPDISMAAANTSTNGYLTSTDWNTFNNKAPATSGTAILYGNGLGGFSNVTIGSGVSFAGGTLSATGTGGTVTSVTATTPLASSGGTTPNLTIQQSSASQAGYLSAADWSTFNGKQPAGTYVNSVTGTSPVVSSGGVNPAISMPAATTSVSGYLTSTDWNTFNGKGSGSVTSVSVVSANGFAGTVATATTTPAITLTTSITGLLKGNGTAISAAVANTDYVPLSTVLTKTADYTIANTDTWIINNKSGSAMTLTFPAASSWTGRSITVKNMQPQLVNSASSNIVPIDSTTAGTAILLGVVGNWATMVSDGTNWVIMKAASNNNLLLE
jgi:hypothetical protein